MPSTDILLITGVSSGFGRALAELALKEGHGVVGTVRNETAQTARAEFEQLAPGRAKARLLDVTDTASHKAARAMLDLIQRDQAPAHLLLGSDALRMASEKLDALKAEIEANRSITLSTDVSA